MEIMIDGKRTDCTIFMHSVCDIYLTFTWKKYASNVKKSLTAKREKFYIHFFKSLYGAAYCLLFGQMIKKREGLQSLLPFFVKYLSQPFEEFGSESLSICHSLKTDFANENMGSFSGQSCCHFFIIKHTNMQTAKLEFFFSFQHWQPLDKLFSTMLVI